MLPTAWCIRWCSSPSKSQIDGGLVKFNKVGYRKVAIPIDVTLKGYIDFADFTVDNVSREGDLLVITLPDPKVMLTASKIDHKKARQYVSSHVLTSPPMR